MRSPPATVRDVAAAIAPSGCAFADMGILGAPPSPSGAGGPRLYVSGPGARLTLALKDYGIDVRVIDGGIGEASAVKMGYACLTKGTQAIGASMMLGAMRNNVSATVKEALTDSLPEVLGYISKQMPRMYPKAYRWVAEMEEIRNSSPPIPARARCWPARRGFTSRSRATSPIAERAARFRPSKDS